MRFVEEEVKSKIEELEHGDTPPYEVIRKLYRTFGGSTSWRGSRPRRRSSGKRPTGRLEKAPRAAGWWAMTMIPIIEPRHYCPGIVTALGVSTGLAGGTIMKSGTPGHMERWGLDLMTMEEVGAWAVTEPDSGSDVLGRQDRADQHQRQQDVHHERSPRGHDRLLTPSSTTGATRHAAAACRSPSSSLA